MDDFYRNASELVGQLVPWIRLQATRAGATGAVVGLSGGIDSAVVALLLKRAFGSNMLGVIMPCYSLDEDGDHARLLAREHDIPVMEVDLAPAFDNLVAAMEQEMPMASRAAKSNLKPRLRMSVLYSLAQERKFLVCGTSNRVEWNLGYFTKFGDSGADLLPLADLLKGEVRDIARLLGVPLPIVDKPPSAGLWAGQTDEEEMGLSYNELDRFFGGGEISPECKSRVEELMSRSEHKRTFPPVFRAGSSD